MVNAWRRGDVETLNRILWESFQDCPSLARRLIDMRNQNWLPKIDAYLLSGNVFRRRRRGPHGWTEWPSRVVESPPLQNRAASAPALDSPQRSRSTRRVLSAADCADFHRLQNALLSRICVNLRNLWLFNVCVHLCESVAEKITNIREIRDFSLYGSLPYVIAPRKFRLDICAA